MWIRKSLGTHGCFYHFFPEVVLTDWLFLKNGAATAHSFFYILFYSSHGHLRASLNPSKSWHLSTQHFYLWLERIKDKVNVVSGRQLDFFNLYFLGYTWQWLEERGRNWKQTCWAAVFILSIDQSEYWRNNWWIICL